MEATVGTVTRPSSGRITAPSGASVRGLPGIGLGAPGSLTSPLTPGVRIQRTYTLAKVGRRAGNSSGSASSGARSPRAGVATQALPFAAPLLTLDLAIQDTIDVLGAIHEDVELQATLHVPVTHALACRIDAYGTVWQAPDIKATGDLSEDDKQYAACLAAPPDLEEAPTFGMSKLNEVIEQSLKMQQQQQGGAATSSVQRPGSSAAATSRSSPFGSMQQQLRAPNPVKSLDSFDEGAAEHASNLGLVRMDTRQQNRMKAVKMAIKRGGEGALAALLGAAYMLQFAFTGSHDLQLQRTSSTASALRALGRTKSSFVRRRESLLEPIREATAALMQAAKGQVFAEVVRRISEEGSGPADTEGCEYEEDDLLPPAEQLVRELKGLTCQPTAADSRAPQLARQ